MRREICLSLKLFHPLPGYLHDIGLQLTLWADDEVDGWGTEVGRSATRGPPVHQLDELQPNDAMTNIPTPPVIHPRGEPRWLWVIVALLLTPFLALAILIAGVSSYFRLSSDTNSLRHEVVKSSGAEWHKLIALNIGGLTFGTARAGLGFARLPEEARVALGAVRGVEFGVYRLSPGARSPDRAAMMNAAERFMTARGWERVIRVMEDGDLVTVYVPKSFNPGQALKCCVLVFDGHQMVIASGKADLESLIQCGLEKLPGALKVNGQRFPSQTTAVWAPMSS